jgi:L-malate glycosyltransferase
MTKVALVYDAIYPFSIGGAERRFFELGTRLAEDGHDVHWYGMKYWPGPDVVQRDGITLHGLCAARPLYTAGGRRSISQAVVFGLSALKLVREDFDVIDCCGFPYFSLLGAKLAAVVRRKPLYATWHEVWGTAYWQTYLGRLGRVGALVERVASRLPDHVVAVSEMTAQRLVDVLGLRGDVRVVPNGIDVAAIRAAPTSDQTCDVISFGRLVDFKNVDVLVRAVQILHRANPGIRATVVGDGPMRAELEQLAASLGLADVVRFTGFIEDVQDVYALLKAARVYVLASAREGFGISVLEANAAGLPVVTVDLPDNAAKDLVDETNGVVVGCDPQSLAAAIEQQLATRGDAERYVDSAAGRDWSAVTAQLEQVLGIAGPRVAAPAPEGGR